MYYGEIKKTDIANGEGVRVSLFVSGCRNCCKGCFNQQTWDFCYGKEFTKETEDESKTEAATETEAAEEGNGYVLPISISFIILLILFIIRWYRTRNKK